MNRGSTQSRLLLRTIVPVAVGIFVGFFLTMLWAIIQYGAIESKWIKVYSRGYGQNNRNQTLKDSTVATKLYDEVKVLCFVTTYPENHQKRAQFVKDTWGRRCNKLLFMSSKKDEHLGTVALNVSEGREFMWEKTKESLKYIYENHFNDFDWFLKAEDDTYVVVENLRYLLSSYDPESPIYFGTKYKPMVKQGYMSGKSGYVLSKEALRRFIEVALSDKEGCPPDSYEDVYVGRCLEFVNVTAGDSRDSLGRGRFFPFQPVDHLVPNQTARPWYWSYMFYASEEGLDCCSANAISFHEVPPKKMYALDYLIYSLQPYGKVKYPQALPKNIITS